MRKESARAITSSNLVSNLTPCFVKDLSRGRDYKENGLLRGQSRRGQPGNKPSNGYKKLRQGRDQESAPPKKKLGKKKKKRNGQESRSIATKRNKTKRTFLTPTNAKGGVEPRKVRQPELPQIKGDEAMHAGRGDCNRRKSSEHNRKKG